MTKAHPKTKLAIFKSGKNGVVNKNISSQLRPFFSEFVPCRTMQRIDALSRTVISRPDSWQVLGRAKVGWNRDRKHEFWAPQKWWKSKGNPWNPPVFHESLGWWNMGVSSNRGTPKSSILIGFSIINHPFWGTPIFGNTHIIIIGQNDEWLVLSHSFRDPYEPSIIYIYLENFWLWKAVQVLPLWKDHQHQQQQVRNHFHKIVILPLRNCTVTLVLLGCPWS